jgi:membrane-associated phospholipid phosphatase
VNKKNSLHFTSPWAWAVPLVSILGLITVWLLGINENLFLSLNNLGKGRVAALFWANITTLGDTMLAFALLSLFVRRRPEVIWTVLITAIFAIFWVHGLKFLINNPRPAAILSGDVINIIGVHLRGGSFPSGHTTTAFIIAGVISNLRINTLLSWIVLLLAILTGLSRAVVGAHWPMDILGGASGGWVIAVISVMLFRQLAARKQWEHHVPGQTVFNTGLLFVAVALFFYDNGYPTSRPFQFTIATMAILVIAYNFLQALLQAKNKRINTNENN